MPLLFRCCVRLSAKTHVIQSAC